MGLKRFLNIRLLLALGLAAGLIGAVACSTSEQPAPVTDSTSGDAATAVPEATDAPAMTEEAGGHVTVLVTNLGNGKFDPFLTEGEDLKFQRIFQVALVGGKGGSELTPAVAKDWSASEDGKVWTSQLTRVVTQPLVRQEVRAWRVPGHRKEAPAGSPVGPPVAWPRATRAVDTDFRSIRRQHPRTPGRSAAWCR